MCVSKDSCAKRIQNVGQPSRGLLSHIHGSSGGKLLAPSMTRERGLRILPNLTVINELSSKGIGRIRVHSHHSRRRLMLPPDD